MFFYIKFLKRNSTGVHKNIYFINNKSILYGKIMSPNEAH